jgi:hypothetical protein
VRYTAVSKSKLTHIGKFDRDASRYHPAVYARKRIDLIKQLDSSLSPLFLGQLKNLHKNAVLRFRTEVADELKGDTYDFAEVTARIRDSVRDEFVLGAKGTRATFCCGDLTGFRDGLARYRMGVRPGTGLIGRRPQAHCR